MKIKKKLKLKQKLTNEIISSFFNLEDEKVQKLNLDENIFSDTSKKTDREEKINIKGSIESKISDKFLNSFNDKKKFDYSQLQMSSSNSINYSSDTKEETFPIGNLNKSLKKLNNLIPNISEKITNDNTIKIYSHPRVFNKTYENYLNNILKGLNNKENELKKKKEMLESELIKLENEIYDKQLNIEVIMDKNFQKNIKEKMIKKYEEKFKEKNDKELLNNIINSQTQKIDKNTLFSVVNKYKDENDIKEQKVKEVQKLFEKKDLKTILKEKTFKSKLNNIILGIQMTSKAKSEKFKIDIKNKKYNKKTICENIILYHEKLKYLHSYQKQIKNKLYMHYLSILKEGKDTRDEGLAWVIAEIFNLGKKVLMSYMPRYLDEKCVLYLFLKAHLMLKINYIEKKINESKKNFIQKGLIKTTHKKEIKNIKAINALNMIKEKFFKNNSDITNDKITNIEEERNSLNSTAINNYKSSALLLKEMKRRLSRSSSLLLKEKPFDYLDDQYDLEYNNNINNNIKFNYSNKNSLKKHQQISFDEYIAYNNEIVKLKKLKEILREEEMKRIFYEFHRNKYSIKYNIDKNNVLSALIGEENISSESFIQNKKERQLNEEILRTRLYRKNDHIKNIAFINNSFRFNGDNNSFLKSNTNLKPMYNNNISFF